MKKWITILLVFVLMFTLTGCGAEKNVEGKLTDLMVKVDEKLDDDLKERLISVELDQDNVINYLGTSDITFKEAIAEENIIGAIAYSVILVRAEEGQDVEALKKTIKENINPRKWVCVGVEDEDVIIKSKGDLVIVIVVADEENRKILEEGFDNL